MPLIWQVSPPADCYKLNQWYSAGFYEIMEYDAVRNKLYEQVIDAKVKDKVVLEVGTGQSIFLPSMCIKAGAKKIHTIEDNANSFTQSAKLIEKLNLQDKIFIYRGYSTEVDINEKADVLLHEIVGCIASNEGMSLVAEDAKKRLLKPDADFIPSRCKTMIAPVAPLKLSWWQNTVNSLFNALLKLSYGKYSTYYDKQLDVYNFPNSNLIAKSQVFEDIIFAESITLKDEKVLEFTVEQDSLFDGFILYLELFVSSDAILNSLTQKTNWPTIYLKLFDMPRQLKQGEKLKVKISRDVSTSVPAYALEVTTAEGITRQYNW